MGPPWSIFGCREAGHLLWAPGCEFSGVFFVAILWPVSDEKVPMEIYIAIHEQKSRPDLGSRDREMTTRSIYDFVHWCLLGDAPILLF
jgi:hypothetical protein